MATREQLDAIAWKAIKAAHTASDYVGKPENYDELSDYADFEWAWSQLLHNFYRNPKASFFSYPPPTELPKPWRCLLAGAAEWLSNEFSLEAQPWVNEPEFFLKGFWDPIEDFCPAMRESRETRMSKTPSEFLKRRVIFESRNLIAL